MEPRIYIFVWFVLLVGIVWALDQLGLSKSAGGTLGFVIASVITIFIVLNGHRPDSGERTSYGEPRATTMPRETWHFDRRGDRKRNTCKSGRGDHKAVFDSRGEAEQFARDRGYRGQSAYSCNANRAVWHLKTDR